MYAARLRGRRLILFCEGSTYLLTSDDGQVTKTVEIPALASSQEETDSRVVLYVKYAAGCPQYTHVRIKSPDSDIFFILLNFANTFSQIRILFDTKIGNQSRLIDITKLSLEYGQEKCSALLGLHGYSGCDTTSAFRGRGKVKLLQKMLKVPAFITTLSQLGDNWELSDALVKDLEQFTCAIYCQNTKISDINEVRLTRLNVLCTKEGRSAPGNVDMSLLPPCRKSLMQHIERVNHQVGIWKRADIAKPDIPRTTDHGWTMTAEGMRPLWYIGECQPHDLGEIAEEQEESETDSDSSSESEDERDEYFGIDSDSD